MSFYDNIISSGGTYNPETNATQSATDVHLAQAANSGPVVEIVWKPTYDKVTKIFAGLMSDDRDRVTESEAAKRQCSNMEQLMIEMMIRQSGKRMKTHEELEAIWRERHGGSPV